MEANFEKPRTIIKTPSGWANIGLEDIWQYRELLVLLIWREIKGAYRQTALGMSWLFLRPIVNVIVLSIVFGTMVKVPSGDFPYPLFSLTGLLPWAFFSQSVMRASRCLIENRMIITRVYFPRMIIPISAVMAGLVDFGASLVVLMLAFLIFQYPIRIEWIYIPIFLIPGIIFSLSVGLWLAAMSVRYRDVQFAVNFLLQALMYLSPVIYSVEAVPEKLLFLYQLNPMTSVIQSFRWSLLGADWQIGTEYFLSLGISIIMLITGAYVFRRTERNMVDIL